MLFEKEVAGQEVNILDYSGNRTLVSVVYVADRLSARCGFGFRGDLKSLDIDPAVLSELRMTDEQVEQICEQLPQLYEEVEGTFR